MTEGVCGVGKGIPCLAHAATLDQRVCPPRLHGRGTVSPPRPNDRIGNEGGNRCAPRLTSDAAVITATAGASPSRAVIFCCRYSSVSRAR
jgi:hypothetical protein